MEAAKRSAAQLIRKTVGFGISSKSVGQLSVAFELPYTSSQACKDYIPIASKY